MRSAVVYSGIFIAVLIGSGCSRSPEVRAARFMERGKALLAKKEASRASLEFLNAVKLMPRDAEAYYQLGLAYLDLHDVAHAAGALRKATELSPKHTGAQLRLASLMSTSRNQVVLQDAQNRIRQVLASSPDNADALDLLALTDLRLGSPKEAAQALQQVLAKSPSHLQSAVTLARLKAGQKDLAGAEDVLKNAVAHAPKSADAALALGQFYIATQRAEQGLAQVDRALQLDPKHPAALLTLAALQLQANHRDQAEQTYRRISALPDKRYRPLHAEYLFQSGQRDAAVREFEEQFKAAPDDRAARQRLVAAYFATGRSKDGEHVLATALKKNPKDIPALLQRSELLVNAGRYADAEADLRQVLHTDADSAVAHYALARVLGMRGLELNQRQELTEAVRLKPDLLGARVALARVMIATGSSREALDLYENAPAPQKNAIALLSVRNWAYVAVGEKAAARKGIDQALAQSRAPELLYQDAVLRMGDKDYNGARASVEEWLRQQPENVQAWQVLADSYAAQKQLPRAFQALRQAIAARPSSAPLQFQLGLWLTRSGKPAEARTAFTAAKNANPSYTPAQLGLAELDFTEGKLDSARATLTALVIRQPQNFTARMLLGNVEERAGNLPAAIAQYRAIAESDQRNVAALNNLAYLLLRSNPDEGLKYAQQAGELAPNNAAVQDTLGWAYYRKGLYDSAVRCLQTAVQKDGTPTRQYHLAMAYLKMGNQELGRKTLAEALQRDPNLAQTQQGW